jgi:putative sigma-54 modulation protein
MNIEFVGRNFQLDDEIREHTTTKLSRVIRFLQEPVEVHVTFEIEKYRRKVDINVHHRHGSLQAMEESDGKIQEAIDLAVDRLGKQAQRARKKFMDRRRRGQRQARVANHWPVDVVEMRSGENSTRPRIVRSRLLHIKPMSIEEAALQLDHSKNEFVVFRDASSDRVSVLYRRKDQNYGLIAPEF